MGSSSTPIAAIAHSADIAGVKRTIVALLERVRSGELGAADAAQRYAQLVPATAAQPTATGRDPTIDVRSTSVLRAVSHPARRLLVFLPFGFGNTSVARWKTALPDNLEAWTVGTDDVAGWDVLVERLVQDILPLCDVPFVVYGHSMGAIVAYHVIVELERRGVSPLAFVPSSAAPPHIFQRVRYFAPFYGMADSTAITTCRERLEQHHFLLPRSSGIPMLGDDGLRCDLALLQSHPDCESPITLRCPIVAWVASHDIVMKDTVMASLWSRYTAGFFSFEEIEGSHLYFMNPSRACFEKLAACCFSSGFEIDLTPGVYDLVAMRQGTDEMFLHPFGAQAAGILLYEQGHMAVHLWNPARGEAHARAHATPARARDAVLEPMISYTCYGGSYQASRGTVTHHVTVSSLPNQLDARLHRYFEQDGGALTLRTAPLVEDGDGQQGAPSGFEKLRWTAAKPAHPRLDGPLGAWALVACTIDGEPRFGDQPRGLLILTASGHLSFIVSRRALSRGRYHNPVLASDDEIIRTADGVDGFVGRFDVAGPGRLDCRVVQGLFLGAEVELPMQWDHDPDGRLELTWTAPAAARRPGSVRTIWRRASDAP